jgi:hypothetical protein
MGSLRALRRHHFHRLKAKAASVYRGWHGNRALVKSSGPQGTVYLTPSEIARIINQLVETHCAPCSCWMCDAHKQKRAPRREDRRVLDLSA